MSLDHDVETIARAAELAGFEADALRLIAFAAPRRTFAAGQHVFSCGDAAPGAMLITSGEILLSLPGEPDWVARVLAGGVIDDMAMFVDAVRAHDAVAASPTTALLLDREIIRRVLVEFPQSAIFVRRGLAERLDRLSAELAQVGRTLSATEPPPR